ncbi:MAG TPA: beta-propeller domain-containing protein, partial [Candidatus Absconditabacterales bacterium]|nr:beta-propeller domain-containing protein [Candidatus Absconditabacterales bacterium]
MKKIIFLLLVIILSTSSISSFATSSTQLGTLSSSITTSTPGGTGLVIDDSLVNAVEQQSQTDLLKELQDAKNSLTLTKAKSCEDFDSVLTKWIEKNKEYFSQGGGGYYGRPMPIDGVAVMEDSTSATAISAKQLDGVGGAGSPDFSATNVQKAGIDEPDIIKNDGQYIYYVNNAKKLLYILKGPYNGTT